MKNSNKVIYALFLLVSIIQAQAASAQFSPYYHENLAGRKILALCPTSESISDAVSRSYSEFGIELDWNKSKKHYEGCMLKYFQYPAIAKAGYKTMEVYEPEHLNIEYDKREEQVTRNIAQSDKEANDVKTKKYISTYDGEGWIKTITYENIFPEYQGYVLKTDSFSYTFHPDGSAEIQRTIDELSTGSGYAGRSGCPDMPKFHEITKHISITMKLNKHKQLTEYRAHSDEQWADCKVPHSVYVRKINYDKEGKPIYMSDSTSEAGIVTVEYFFNYHTIPLRDFLDSVKDIPQYSSFKSPTLDSFFKEHSKPFYMAISEKVIGYTRYHDTLRKQVPITNGNYYTRTDSAFFILNKERRRIAEWRDRYTQYNDPNAFRFYTYQDGEDSSLMQMQYLHTNGEVAHMVYKTRLRRTDKIIRTNYTLHTYSSGDRLNEYQREMKLTRFKPVGISASLPYYTSAMVLADNAGLIKYVWTDRKYKIAYKK